MANKKTKAAGKTAALTPEEFQKLTPEEQVAYLNELQAGKAAAEAKAEAATKAAAKAGKVELPVIKDVPEDEDNDVEAGDYQFTAPTFTWDDNSVIVVKELVADLESKDKKVREKAETIVAHLLARHSGLLVKLGKED